MTDEEQAEAEETHRRYVEHIVIPRILASCETPADFVKFDEIQQGRCTGFSGPCDTGLPGKFHRQNTQYHKQIQNYGSLCSECQKESDDYWAEMWANYRADQGF